MPLHIYPVTIRSVSPPIPGLLSRPTQEARTLPTILFFHGLNAGRQQVFQDKYSGLAHAVQELGCNLLSVELRCHGDRRESLQRSAVENLLPVITHEEKNPFIGALEDFPKIMEFIIEKKISDPNQVAVAGLSWGGLFVLFALKQERRLRCGAAFLPVCKITGLIEFRGLEHQPVIQRYEPLKFIQEIAPTPLLILTAEQDRRAEPRYAGELYEHLQPEYQAAGAADHLAYAMIPGIGHTYDDRMTEIAKRWFKTHLLGEILQT